MILDIQNNKIVINKNNDEIYTILKRTDKNFDLFIKYADDEINYFIKNFDNLFECLQFVKIGLIRIF